MDVIDWQPGENGKGIVDQDGNVHAWNDENYELHRDYIDTSPNVLHANAYFYINQDGTIEITMPNPIYDGRERHDLMMKHILDADPEFHEATGSDWNF